MRTIPTLARATEWIGEIERIELDWISPERLWVTTEMISLLIETKERVNNLIGAFNEGAELPRIDTYREPCLALMRALENQPGFK